jgi:5'-AMP-activated protein kinase regulatory gamma subunit
MWYLGGEEDSDFLEDLSKKENNQQKSQQAQHPQSATSQLAHLPPQPSSPKLHALPSPSPHLLRVQKSHSKMYSPHIVPQSDPDNTDLSSFILHSSTEISPLSSKSSSRLNTPSSSRPATPTNSIPTNITLTLLAEEERIKNRRAFAEFLKSHACYDIMPASVKIVVLDTKLAIQSAFQALVENGIKAAPLWDSTNHEYNGMITVSDFIDILLKFSKDSTKMNNIIHELANYQIKTWRETNQTIPSLISVEPDMTLLEASNLLVKYQIHRLPVIDGAESNSVLHMITHYRILNFLVRNFPSPPLNPILQCTIGSLGIGTYDHVVTVLADTPLIVVLDLLAARKISAVPIVDEHGVVIDVYSKSDAPQIVKMGVLTPTDLDRPVSELLHLHNKRSEQIMTCLKTEALKDILDKCLAKRVHRLIIVDSTKRVEGIVSLSDIFSVLRLYVQRYWDE